MNKKLCMVLLALMLMLMSCVALGANKDLSVYEGLDENVKNILVIGKTGDTPSTGRAEMVMICSINKETGKVNLVSLAGDTWVDVKGHGMRKLSAAYNVGREELLMQTVNATYSLNIEKYMTIDLDGISSLIDMLGGVTVTLEKDEPWMINKLVKERDIPGSKNIKSKVPSNAAEATLCGAQAVAYMGSMDLGNDFDRQNRQRKVIMAMAKKVKSGDVENVAGLVTKGFGMVSTNLTLPESIELIGTAMTVDLSKTGLYRFPGEGEYSYDSKNGVSKLIVDTAYGTQKIHSILYPAAE